MYKQMCLVEAICGYNSEGSTYPTSHNCKRHSLCHELNFHIFTGSFDHEIRLQWKSFYIENNKILSQIIDILSWSETCGMAIQ